MRTETFKGGIHPPEHKELSAHNPIETVATLKKVVIPINQHFGAPIKPLVAVGDVVKRGQKIADSQDRMTVPLHASISGTVKKIESHLMVNNMEGQAIIIEADGSGEEVFLPVLDPFACAKDEAIARIREAGIIGIGGAGFPAYVKLSPPPDKPIEYVIANGAECEPYLTIDERTMEESPEDVVDGLAIVMHVVKAKFGVIGLEDNKKHLLPILEKAVEQKSRGMDIRVVLLKTKYPQGGEKMLITAVTKREVPSGKLPMDVACVVNNVGTLKTISEAFRKGRTVVDTALTISGRACKTPKNLVVPVGTVVQDLVGTVVQIEEDKVRRIVMGGPMMGPAVPSAVVPLQKNTSGVLFLTADEAKAYEEGSCIRCGRCMKACSCRLSPALINKALAANDLDEAAAIGLLDCIECGSCSFVCPAHVLLVQRFRIGKQKLRVKMQKEAQRAAK